MALTVDKAKKADPSLKNLSDREIEHILEDYYRLAEITLEDLDYGEAK